MDSLGDNVRESMVMTRNTISAIQVPSSSRHKPNPVSTAASVLAEATRALVLLDITALSPGQSVAILDCFRDDSRLAETYIVLSSNMSEQCTAVRKAWLATRLADVAAVKAAKEAAAGY